MTDPNSIDLPDIRVVTITVDASDGLLTDVEVDASGTGYYESVGMVVCALVKMLDPSWADDDPDDDADDDPDDEY
jgi:hypothetical protein